jgi:hypothetical protein
MSGSMSRLPVVRQVPSIHPTEIPMPKAVLSLLALEVIPANTPVTVVSRHFMPRAAVVELLEALLLETVLSRF